MYFQYGIDWKLRKVSETNNTSRMYSKLIEVTLNIQIKEPKILRHNNKQSTPKYLRKSAKEGEVSKDVRKETKVFTETMEYYFGMSGFNIYHAFHSNFNV